MKSSLSLLNATLAQIRAGSGDKDSHASDVTALLAYWQQNKFPLLALNHDSDLPEILKSTEARAARDAENAVYSSLKREFDIIRDRWAQAGIRSLLIKSGGFYPSFPYTSDNLDVLILEKDKVGARAILLEEGYIELKNIEEPKKFLFRKFAAGASVSAIHLHTRVGWLVGFMDDKAVWERAQAAPDDPATTIPSPEDIILINIAHSLYENKKLRLSDLVKIREWWGRENTDWAYLEKVAEHRGWQDGLLFGVLLYAHLEEAVWGETILPSVIRKTWESSLKRSPLVYRYYQRAIQRTPVSLPFNLSFVFSKYLYYKKILNDKSIGFAARLREVVQTLAIGVKVRTRIRPQPSFLVSFSGPDGSGKTVHAKNLEKILDICEVDKKYYWNRAATSRFIRSFSAIIKTLTGKKTETGDAKPGAAGREARLRNPVVRFFWIYLAALDMVWQYFVHVRLPLLIGRVVVCDRYVYDAAAEIEGSLPANDRLNRLAIRLMLALAPRPDAAYLLDVPEEICAQRKSDNTDADYLHRQRKAYLDLAARYNLKVKKTDGEFGPIADEITREVMIAYYRDYGTFIRGLFLSNPGQLNRPLRGESK